MFYSCKQNIFQLHTRLDYIKGRKPRYFDVYCTFVETKYTLDCEYTVKLKTPTINIRFIFKQKNSLVNPILTA